MLDRSERLSAIETVARDAFTWIEARIEALDASDMAEERKTYWRERWREQQREIGQIGARVHADRNG